MESRPVCIECLITMRLDCRIQGIFNEVEQRFRKADKRVDFHAVEAGVQQDDDLW